MHAFYFSSISYIFQEFSCGQATLSIGALRRSLEVQRHGFLSFGLLVGCSSALHMLIYAVSVQYDWKMKRAWALQRTLVCIPGAANSSIPMLAAKLRA